MHFLSIFLPIIALAAGVAAYLQYRNNPAQKVAGAGREGRVDEDHAVSETVYQGLLWMKQKYEEERELSTAKHMELKEEYEALREEYQKLQTAHAYTQELLNERQSTIDRLRNQLQQEAQRTTEAKGKLESSGHLLLQMHKELDLVLAGGANDTIRKGGQARAANEAVRKEEARPGEAEAADAHAGEVDLAGAPSGEADLAKTQFEEADPGNAPPGSVPSDETDSGEAHASETGAGEVVSAKDKDPRGKPASDKGSKGKGSKGKGGSQKEPLAVAQ